MINRHLGLVCDSPPDNVVCMNFEDGSILDQYSKLEMILIVIVGII